MRKTNKNANEHDKVNVDEEINRLIELGIQTWPKTYSDSMAKIEKTASLSPKYPVSLKNTEIEQVKLILGIAYAITQSINLSPVFAEMIARSNEVNDKRLEIILNIRRVKPENREKYGKVIAMSWLFVLNCLDLKKVKDLFEYEQIFLEMAGLARFRENRKIPQKSPYAQPARMFDRLSKQKSWMKREEKLHEVCKRFAIADGYASLRRDSIKAKGIRHRYDSGIRRQRDSQT